LISAHNPLIYVITTIQSPTQAVHQLLTHPHFQNAQLIVIGDSKGPSSYPINHATFLSLQDQLESSIRLARLLPINHYSRKNIGYLTAIAQGASCIYETDDDNAPLPSWIPRDEMCEAISVATQDQWVNIYNLFTEKLIWPRGFPLDEIDRTVSGHPVQTTETPISVRAPIQQGLVNNSPDVDAIWRLILDQPVQFRMGKSYCLQPRIWSPFNSQSTWWWPQAYPLLYLPSYCSLRMTDIWRSFIAQRCLWELDTGLVFHAPEVVQVRNEHNLMDDFRDEIQGYIKNTDFVNILEKLSLDKGPDSIKKNMIHCYNALSENDFINPKEIRLVQTWLDDLEYAINDK